MNFKLAGALAVGIALLTVVPVLAAAKDVASLQNFSDGSKAGGNSKLVRDGAAGTVASHINATHLMPGGAYTYWYVIFNNPELCSDGVCGEDDLFVDPETPNVAQINAVGIAVLGGNGEVANNGGRAAFSGGLTEGVIGSGLDIVIGPGGLIPLGPGMLQGGKAMTAEIHIVIRNHGEAQTGVDLFEQLNRFWGNCTNVPVDDDPTFECIDEQFAVHLP